MCVLFRKGRCLDDKGLVFFLCNQLEYLIKTKPKISETTQFMVLKVLGRPLKWLLDVGSKEGYIRSIVFIRLLTLWGDIKTLCSTRGPPLMQLSIPRIPLWLIYVQAVDFCIIVRDTLQSTVVELSTRTAFLNIDQSLQFRIFWFQSKALFMIRCMLSAGSGSKTFGAMKVTICVNFF
jgi:hypothetical protein